MTAAWSDKFAKIGTVDISANSPFTNEEISYKDGDTDISGYYHKACTTIREMQYFGSSHPRLCEGTSSTTKYHTLGARETYLATGRLTRTSTA
jgi:hypothetical protein